MAIFPTTAPPNNELWPKSTSTFFKSEERAYFAQAGTKIASITVRADSEVDFPSPRQLPSAPLLYHLAVIPTTRQAPEVSVPPLSSHTPTSSNQPSAKCGEPDMNL